MTNKNHYVYYFDNKINGLMYIGKGVRGRMKLHISAAYSLEGTYGDQRDTHLHRAIRKYGIENFDYGIFQYCQNEDEAYLIEEEWIERLKQNGIKLYNLAKGGKGSTQQGLKRSEKTRNKMSQSLKAHYEIYDSPLKGIPFSEERKKKLSEVAMGKPGTNNGKKFNNEWVLKISKSNAGKENKLLRRFTEETEKEICQLYVEQEISGYKLAQIYNCAKSLIYDILDRNNIQYHKNNYTGHSNGKNIFTKEEELEICKLYEKGDITRKALSEKFKCGKTTIRNILLRNNIKL